MVMTQCAWCREVKIGGSFVGLGLTSLVHQIDLPARNGRQVHYIVSHGICEPCKDRLIGHSSRLN